MSLLGYPFNLCEVLRTQVFEIRIKDLRAPRAYARIETRTLRLAMGLAGDVRPVGGGVSELRIDHGPGYRVYFPPKGVGLGHPVGRRRQADPGPRPPDGDPTGCRLLTFMEPPLEQPKRKPARKASPPPLVARGDIAPYDAAEHLDPARMEAVMEAAFEDGHPRVISAALGALARARGMARIAEDTGLNPKSLYRSLSPEGNPELDTVMKVVGALGLRLHATADGRICTTEGPRLTRPASKVQEPAP